MSKKSSSKLTRTVAVLLIFCSSLQGEAYGASCTAAERAVIGNQIQERVVHFSERRARTANFDWMRKSYSDLATTGNNMKNLAVRGTPQNFYLSTAKLIAQGKDLVLLTNKNLQTPIMASFFSYLSGYSSAPVICNLIDGKSGASWVACDSYEKKIKSFLNDDTRDAGDRSVCDVYRRIAI